MANGLLGVIGSKIAHLLADNDRSSIVPGTNLYVDIGARSRQEVLAMGVARGHRRSDKLHRQPHRIEAAVGPLHGTRPQRPGRGAVLLTLLERTHDAPPPVTLILVFSVQEEVGLRGVQALTRHLQGDVALTLAITAVDDTPEFSSTHLQLGAGPPSR